MVQWRQKRFRQFVPLLGVVAQIRVFPSVPHSQRLPRKPFETGVHVDQ